MKKRLLSALLVLAIVLTVMPVGALADDEDDGRTYLTVEKVEDDTVAGERLTGGDEDSTPLPETQRNLDPDEEVRVSIVLERPSTIKAGYSTVNIASNSMAMSYREGLRQDQETVQMKIERQVLGGGSLDVVWNMTLAANIISANVKRGEIEAIENVAGVKKVIEETRYEPQVISAGGELEPNMAISGTMNGAQNVWKLGMYGASSKIAIIDTGLDTDHQSFDAGAFEEALEGQEDVDLLTKEEVSGLIDKLNIKSRAGITGLSAENVYLTSKVPFAYNYVDGDNDVTHDNDSQGEHGSHVAGIAAANRLIPVKDGGETTYVDAIKTVKMAGNAPDAQLLIMKVFGKRGGAFDSDYMVAIEDAIILGADAINLSLGSTAAGFATDTTYQSIFDDLANSDSVVTVSAGNSGSWADYTAYGRMGYGLYNDGVNFDTIGSPGSYGNSFTVASVENTGFISNMFSVGEDYFDFFETLMGPNPSLATLDKDPNFEGTEFDFVMLDDTTAGHEKEALDALKDNGVELKDKIVVVHRGSTSFAEKATACVNAGAVAVFIANNDTGYMNMDLTGFTGNTPVVSLTEAGGEDLYETGEPETFEFTYKDEEAENGTETVEAGYITGKMKIYGTPVTFDESSDYYTMSDFSSWGVPGDLNLKPEITAPGGNIWSVNGVIKDGKSYELMSGTSMAAPQIAGLTALVKEYLRSKGISEDLSSRALTQSLLMSTATPMTDRNGSFYPVFQQGAGLANVNSAVTTPAYITVEGQDDGKVKAELGDDPAKTGTYTVDFTVHNLTDDVLLYAFDANTFTQDYEAVSRYQFLLPSTRALGADVVFTVDGEELTKDDVELLKYDFDGDNNVDKKDAQLLLDSIIGDTEITHNADNRDVNGDGAVNTYDVYVLLTKGQAYASVPAHGSVDVTATITLTADEVAKLAEENPAGAYVEAYITATAKATPEGVAYPELSIPVLGYYGSWTDPSMYDAGGLGAGAQKMPYLFYSTGGNTNFISTDSDTVRTMDGDAIGEGVDVSKYYYTLIRNAGSGIVQIRNADTKELYWQSAEFGRSIAAFIAQSGAGVSWNNVQNTAKINWKQTDMDGEKLPSGTRVTVSLIMAPEYYAEADGTYDWEKLTNGVDTADDKELHGGAYLSTTICIDTVAPEIVTEGDDAPHAIRVKDEEGEEHLHIVANVKDDVSVAEIGLINEADNSLVYDFSPSVVDTSYDPIFEPTGPGEVFKAEFDGTHELYYNSYLGFYIDYGVEKDLEPSVYILAVYDLAGNESLYRIFADIEETKEVSEVHIFDESGEAIEEPVVLVKGEQFQFTGTADPYTLSDRSVKWSSSDENVLTIDENGVATAVGGGKATVTAAATLDEKVTDTVEVEVFVIEAELNGIVYDNDSNIWWSKFNTGNLPDVTHLTEEPVDGQKGPFFMAAAYGPDGQLYASTQEDHGSGLVSDLYKINTETFEAEKIGGSENAGYVDMAETKSLGENVLIGVYGPHVILIDTETGKELGAFSNYLTDGSYLVGIAYLGTDHIETIESGLDMYLMIASDGSVYEEVFLQYGDSYAYMLGTEDGYLGTVSALDIGDMFYNNSAYISDDYLFWSRYEEDGDSADLFALDIISENGTGGVFDLGSFGEGVWPVSGLFKLGSNGASSEAAASLAAKLAGATVKESALLSTEAITPLPIPAVADGASETGTLDSIDTGENTPEPKNSNVTVDMYSMTVTVPVYADSTNGDVTVAYDTGKLTLRSVNSNGTALTSYTQSAEDRDGKVRLGFAQKSAVNGVVATLVFGYSYTGETKLSLTVTEDGETTYTEPTTTEYPVSLLMYVPPTPVDPGTSTKPSTPEKPEETIRFKDVPDGKWYADAVYELAKLGIINGVGDDRFAPSSNADRAAVAVMLYRIAGEPEVDVTASFEDVPAGSWYAKAVAWALDAGVITGTSETTFMPKRMITRQELVTILWRYAKDNGYDVTANGFVMPNFADLDQVAGYAGEAMCWAVRAGVLRGTDANRLMPKSYATRAEIAVILSRFLTLEKAVVEK